MRLQILVLKVQCLGPVVKGWDINYIVSQVVGSRQGQGTRPWILDLLEEAVVCGEQGSGSQESCPKCHSITEHALRQFSRARSEVGGGVGSES